MMRIRPGLARLVPLAVLTGLAAGTIALLARARPARAPAAAMLPDAPDAPTHYTIVDLGCLPNCNVTDACAVNNRGQVAGFCYESGVGVGGCGHGDSTFGHAFLWQGGKMTALGTLGGEFSHALAIDQDGDVVGDA